MAEYVEVVRCKDCQFSTTAYNPFEDKLAGFCIITRSPVNLDHFCGYGDRKEEPYDQSKATSL